ncbi:hypothetical protein AB8B21_28740 [Tardiphaga sp. 866_E4_N2_1]
MRRISALLVLLALSAVVPLADALAKAQQDAAQCPVPSLAAPSVGDAARP